ncbi:MAG: hypothetical protein ACSHXJ_00735 [Marinomonas colpomeniae]
MKSTKNNLSYIIGDSAVRAFAYNNHFIPIMISAGAFNCHLTVDSSKGVCERYKAFFEEYSLDGESVYFFTNGDTIHHVRDTFDTLVNDNIPLYEAALRYVDMILMLIQEFPINAIILSSIPLEGDLGMASALAYNECLKKLAKKNNIKYVDIWGIVTRKTNGKVEIKPEYRADDVGHLNHRFIYDFLISIGEAEESQHYWDVEYERYYNYEMPIAGLTGQKAKIWGDCHKDNLILDEKMTYQFNLFHQRTNEHEALLKMLNPIFTNILSYESVTIDGCKDGYVAFSLSRMRIFKNINAQDSNQNFIHQANALKKVFKFLEIDFFNKSDEEMKINDVVFSLTSNLLSKKSKVKYLRDLIKKDVEVLIYYSTDVYNDCKILRKNGFKKIYKILVGYEGVQECRGCYFLCFSSKISTQESFNVLTSIFFGKTKSKFYRYMKSVYNLKKKYF